jgi:hypothetical protein
MLNRSEIFHKPKELRESRDTGNNFVENVHYNKIINIIKFELDRV